MRKIIFRAWDNKNKKWLLGYELENLGGFSLFGEAVLLGEWAKILDTFLFNRDGVKFEDLEVMQCIGIEDRKGKKIYEGDIVEWRINDTIITAPVYYDEQQACFWMGKGVNAEGGKIGLVVNDWMRGEYEVVGNIYESKTVCEEK